MLRAAVRTDHHAVLQIVMRGIFNVPMAGAEELTRYFLICLTFMAGALVTVEGGQSGWRSSRRRCLSPCGSRCNC